MLMTDDKQFAIGMVVSCKRLECRSDEELCAHCVESFVGQNVLKYSHFSLSQATTGNHSKQFVVSFIAHCRKPDCASVSTSAEVCCTASADKCEMCLRTIVGGGIREMYGFHAKEIVVA